MTAADRPSVTDDTRAVREAAMSLYRAMRRTNPDAWAEVDEVEDWTYWDDIVRTAQVTLAAGRAETTTDEMYEAGYKSGYHDGYPAGYGAARAETTTATTEDAEEVLHGAGWFARADLDPRDLHGILHDLADAGLLATARTRPTETEWGVRTEDGRVYPMSEADDTWATDHPAATLIRRECTEWKEVGW